MRKWLFILFLFLSNLAMAGTFIVTSPLDDGSAGTFRWAITQANSNGSTATDFINFNIPSGNPLFRVIQLNSELPVLTSNVIIDGTTQALGAPYGPTQAKIMITTKNFNTCKRGLILRDATNIEIYGIYFAGFISKTPLTPETWSDGIFMCHVSNITIGAPGRGNAFSLNYHSIRNQALNENGSPLAGVVSHHITVQNNYIGKNYTPATPTPPLDGTINGVELLGVHDVLVGGYAAAEKNEFMVFSNGIRIELNTSDPAAPAFAKVINNNFIPGTFATPPPLLLPILGIEVFDNTITPGNHFVTISHNIIFTYSTGISLANLGHPFSIENNNINLNLRDNQLPVTTAINIAACDSGLVGQKDSSNIIRDTKNFGIVLAATKYITINQNSMYCNPKGISIVSPAIIIPKITELVADPAAAISGKTCSRCAVEIFTTDECTGQIYNGKTLSAVELANAVGDWSYRGPVDCNTSYTVTDPNKATSEFYTAANFIIDTTAVIKQNASCGQSNGSIKGIRIFAGVDFHWEDALGNTISIDTNLVNLAPGFYKLVCIKKNLGCRLTTGLYEIKDVTPVINSTAAQLVHPSTDCRVKGAVTGIQVTGGPASSFTYQWTNQLGIPVGSALNLGNVPAGSYTLTVFVNFDLTCFKTAGPFILADRPAPQFNLAALVIKSATCGKPNGSIRGIGITNAYAAQQFRWFDAAGNIVGNAIDLSNAAPGSYYLEYDDASPCPAISSPVYTVANNGLVTVDAGNKIIEASGCTVIKGAIKNIVVTGANLYEWVNTATGIVVANTVDLLNVASGNYRLRAYDTNYGCADSSEIFFVPLTTIQPLNIQNKTVKDETCTGANGSISNIVFQPAAVGYNFKWIRNTIDTFTSALNIFNLIKADYTLIAYDSNGCVQTVLQQTINDHPSPVIDESGISLANDTCTQKLGSIKNMASAGGDLPFNYLWYNTPGNTIAGNNSELKNIGTGNYFMILTDKNGCRDTSTVLFIGNENLLLDPPQYEAAYAKRNMQAYIKNLNSLPGIYELFDSPAGGIPLQFNTTGTFRTQPLAADKDFWVQRSVGSCKSIRVKVHVNVVDFSRVLIPNAFTPNNDGRNDVLTIKVLGKIAIDYFIIYNRWGQQIFITSDVKKGWDGRINGMIQSTGTYAWVLQGYDIDGTPIHLKGTVTILQ